MTDSYWKLEIHSITTTRRAAYSEEHPAAGKGHLLDGVRLVCESAILLFQVFQRNGHIYNCALEPPDLLET